MKSSRGRLSLGWLLAALLSHGNLVVAVQAQSKHQVTLEDLRSLNSVTYLQLAPNAAALAYTESAENGPAGEPALWVVKTQQGSMPRQIATGMLPLWSPNSQYIAYASSRSGSLQLWVFDIDSMRAEQITNVPNGIDPDIVGTLDQMGGHLGFRWSPDGTKLIFPSRVPAPALTPPPDRHDHDRASDTLSNDPAAPLILTTTSSKDWTLAGIFAHGFGAAKFVNGQWQRIDTRPQPATTSQLFIVNLRTKELHQLTHDTAGYFEPDWSPDGTTIVCASAEGRSPGWRLYPNIYLIDVATGRKKALTTGLRDRWLPRWSPDGKFIAYWDGPHVGRHTVSVIPSSGGTPFDPTSALDDYAYEFYWSADSRSLILSHFDGIRRAIAEANIHTAQTTPLVPHDQATQSHLTVAASGTIAWTQNDGSTHSILMVLSAGTTSAYQLLDPNPQIKNWNIGTEEILHWKNKHGDNRQGVLLKPYGYRPGRRYPLIVDCYPDLGIRFGGDAMGGNQAWASRGYAVLIVNPRAPHTWMVPSHRKDQEAVRGPKGWEVTVDDVMSGVDELIRQGIVDPERMGLYGFSNGGGVVDYLVTKTHRFKCAVSVAGVLPDWFSPVFLEAWDGAQIFAGGITPWDDPEGYIQLSAIFHINAVTTPMLLADGDEDGDMVLGMIEMYNGLRTFGRDVTLLRYPNQGHGFTGRALADFWARENAFFDRYLKPSLPSPEVGSKGV